MVAEFFLLCEIKSVFIGMYMISYTMCSEFIALVEIGLGSFFRPTDVAFTMNLYFETLTSDNVVASDSTPRLDANLAMSCAFCMVLFAIVIFLALSFAKPATIALAAPPEPSNK